VEVIRYMHASGVTHIAECGPGKVLAGLSKRIAADLQGCAITDPQSLAATLESLQ
jgi:[acyl-carrier-protein] S-malonyltransferase